MTRTVRNVGQAVLQMVEALSYKKPEGRGFSS